MIVKRITTNSTNPCFILATFQTLADIFRRNDEKKLSYKYYSKRITTRDNRNVQSHDKEESKFNSTITANSGAHTVTHFFNFSKYELSDCEKGLLAKGLNFSLPSKYLDYADYLVNFELFYRNIRNLDILSNEDLDFVKTRTKEAALYSYRNYNNNVPQHLS